MRFAGKRGKYGRAGGDGAHRRRQGGGPEPRAPNVVPGPSRFERAMASSAAPQTLGLPKAVRQHFSRLPWRALPHPIAASSSSLAQILWDGDGPVKGMEACGTRRSGARWPDPPAALSARSLQSTSRRRPAACVQKCPMAWGPSRSRLKGAVAGEGLRPSSLGS
jgi:hypothetical protein